MTPPLSATKVVSLRGLRKWEWSVYCDVYIGRPSLFGNPFFSGRDGTRAEVIEKYEKWARYRMEYDPEFRKGVAELRGKRLGCWCAPLPCHGDVLAKLTEELHQLCLTI